MIKSSYKIIEIYGIPIYIRISMIILLIFVLSQSIHGAQTIADLLVIASIFLFFIASIVLHELAHSLVAKLFGIEVIDISLSFIGGVARMSHLPTKPASEILISVAGPAASLFIALSSFIMSTVLYGAFNANLLSKVFLSICYFNFMLGLFNLVPAFPMDGGRILRAYLSIKNNRLTATRQAFLTGKYIAILMAIQGITALPGRLFISPTIYNNSTLPLFIERNDIPGIIACFLATPHLILPILAWFIYSAGKKEYLQQVINSPLNQNLNSFFDFFNYNQKDEDYDEIEISPPPYSKSKKTSSYVKKEKL